MTFYATQRPARRPLPLPLLPHSSLEPRTSAFLARLLWIGLLAFFLVSLPDAEAQPRPRKNRVLLKLNSPVAGFAFAQREGSLATFDIIPLGIEIALLPRVGFVIDVRFQHWLGPLLNEPSSILALFSVPIYAEVSDEIDPFSGWFGGPTLGTGYHLLHQQATFAIGLQGGFAWAWPLGLQVKLGLQAFGVLDLGFLQQTTSFEIHIGLLLSVGYWVF